MLGFFAVAQNDPEIKGKDKGKDKSDFSEDAD